MNAMSWENIIKNCSTSFFIVDQDLRISFANPATVKLTGYPDVELKSKPIDEIIQVSDKGSSLNPLLSVLKKHENWQGREKLKRKDKSFLDVRVQVQPIADSQDMLVAIQENMRFQSSLEETLAMRLKLQVALNKLSEVALSGSSLKELMNQAVLQLKDILQVEYTKILELLPGGENVILRAGEGWQKHIKVDESTVDTGPMSQAGYTLQEDHPVIVRDLRTESRFDGPPLLRDHNVISGMSVIIYGLNRSKYGVLGIHTTKFREFTDDDVQYLQSVANIIGMAVQRHQIQQKLNLSEGEFKTLTQTIPHVIWVCDQNGKPEYFNHRWYENISNEASDGLKMEWEKLIHPEEVEEIVAKWEHSMESSVQFETECRIKHFQTGEYRWYLMRALPMKDSSGNVLKWFGTATDINDKKKSEESMRRSEKLFSTLYDANVIGLLTSSYAGGIEQANDAFLNMIGYTREEIENGDVDWQTITPEEYRERDQEAADELEKTGTIKPYEKEILHKSGYRIWVLVSGAIINSFVNQILILALDITERKKLEERKDEFIGIASHELKTPLTSVKAYIQILEQIISEIGNKEAIQYTQKANMYLSRLNSLIDDLLDVSKIQAGKLQMQISEFNFGELVMAAIENVQATSGRHEIIYEKPPDIIVRGDKNRIEQVLYNLLSNAIKYSPNSYQIHVRVYEKDNMICCAIRDFGIGVPQSSREKIFGRFYRDQEHVQYISGLGIGLYISNEIVKRHNGSIWVESEEGKGSEFTFCLPVG